jgi:hypothetical protein
MKGCIALTLLSFSVVLFLCILNDTIIKKEEQLNEVYKNIDVECVISNVRGTQTDNLYIADYIVALFLSNESTYLGVKDEIPFSSYVKDLKLKLTLKYELLAEGQEVLISDIFHANDLIGLTHLSTDSTLMPENNIGITYFENYSDALFLSDEAVCIISEELYKTLPKDEEGNCYVNLAVGDSGYNQNRFAEQRLKVVGTFEGDSFTIYCPWEIIRKLSTEITGVLHADSLSFSVKNNMQIDSLKKLLARYFTYVDLTGTLKPFTASDILINYEYAVTVYDDILNKTASTIEDDIKVLKILQPIIIMSSLFLAFLASFMFVRNRKQEFAIMRSLGTKKGMVFGEAFMEQFFLGLIGAALGLIGFYVMYQYEIQPPWGNILAFVLCYLIGSSMVVYWIVNVKVLAILREE